MKKFQEKQKKFEKKFLKQRKILLILSVFLRKNS